jgi:hypothetical protein
MSDQLLRNVDTAVMAGFKGVLVISNPCLGVSRRVGRVDNAWDASFAKLEQAIEIARERELMPLIVGDLLMDSRDIGQLLPIINLLHNNRALLLPRNVRWQERSEGHIAAILKATGVAHVAGASARKFQLPISSNGKIVNMELETYTSWGGVERLEHGTVGYIKIPAMNLTIMQSSALPVMEGDESGTRIVAGRLIRLTPVEESMAINVYAVTNEGIESIALNIMPIVFSTAAGTAEQTNDELKRDSLFVKKLRESAMSSLEEEGKESLVTLVDEVCDELETDDWMRSLILELAKDAGAAVAP